MSIIRLVVYIPGLSGFHQLDVLYIIGLSSVGCWVYIGAVFVFFYTFELSSVGYCVHNWAVFVMYIMYTFELSSVGYCVHNWAVFVMYTFGLSSVGCCSHIWAVIILVVAENHLSCPWLIFVHPSGCVIGPPSGLSCIACLCAHI